MRTFPTSARVIALLLVCLTGLPAGRASASDTVTRGGLVVRVWQSQDGLPGNVVRSVVQASDGYLWVATAEGVARFDGYDFKLVEPEWDPQLRRMAFFRLFATSGGVVWAATYQGGLLRAEAGRLVNVLEAPRGPNPPRVTQLIEDARGVVCFKRGDLVGRVAGDAAVIPIERPEELEPAFAEDLRRQLAGGRSITGSGNPGLTDAEGSRWFELETGELAMVRDGGEPEAVEFPQRGTAFGVNELMLDREGNVWVASPVNGLARVRPARVERLAVMEDESEQSFVALMEDRSGAWWLANRQGGLIRWTPGGSRHLDLTTSRRPVAAMFEDKDSRLWFGSRDGSVFVEENGEFVPQFVRTQTPSKVRAMTQDRTGTLWFGGSQGLASLAGGVVRSFGETDGVDGVDITVIQLFPGGKIIAGTSDGQVLLGDHGGFATVAAPQVMDHKWISGILPLAADEVWVSTLGGGLLHWNGKSWHGFGLNEGLPDLRLTCVLDDGRDNLWFGSLSGIIRAERKGLLARLRQPDAPLRWLRLDHTDGLPSRECVGGFQPAGWKGRDGNLWFPTGGGVGLVRPGLVKPNQVPPPVFIQSVRANGVVRPPAAGPLVTPPGRARLEFGFVGLGFSAPEKTTYRVRLTGLDDAWRELGTQRFAAFETVPPGDYTFEVMAVNGDGTRSAVPATLRVRVRPHLWQTAWFYVSVGGLVVLAAAGTGWFAARRRMKRRIQQLKIRHARESERARIARDLHDDLGASLTEISILSSLAAEDAENNRLKPSLDHLSVKTKLLVSSLDEIVWAVNPREDTLRSLVDYLAAFAREFLDSARIRLRVDVGPGIPALPLDATRRHGVFLAAREVLNNVVKHAEATEVQLRFALAADGLAIRISDDGCGFSPATAGPGNGLGNLNTRMREVGGDCRIESHPGQGTTAFLNLGLQLPGKPVC